MSPLSFAKKRVLIAGGLGFIGSSLARRLDDLGAAVTLVDSLAPEQGGNTFNIRGLESRVNVSVSDVRDERIFASLIGGKDYLFNLVGQTGQTESMQEPLSILEACRRHNPGVKIVFAGARQVYGKPRYLPVDEKHPLQPVDVSGVHKLAGENYHAVYRNAYGIRNCVLRLTNTIGPRMRVKDARQTFVGLWLRLLLEGKPIPVWGGRQLRDFTYIDDAVEAFLLAAASAKADGEVFNLGGCGHLSLKDLGALLVKIHGKGGLLLQPYPPEQEPTEIGDYYADFSKIKTALGWRPKTALPEALDATLVFYKENLGHYL